MYHCTCFPEFSLPHCKIDELLCTARSQHETIKVLSAKLNVVLSFLDAPGGLALQGGKRCAVGGSTDIVNLPKPSISSLAELQGAPDQPHPAQPTSYSSAVGVQAGQTRRQPSCFRFLTTDLILIFRIIFGLVDVCMSDYFQLMSSDGDRAVTRGNPFKLSVNYCRTNTRKNFLANML